MNPRTPRRRLLSLAAVAVLAGLLTVGCSKDSSDTSSTKAGPGTATGTIRIGSQKFSESRTLAEVYAQYLKAKGFRVSVEAPIADRTQLLAAMVKGTVDLELDYTGSAVTELGGKAEADPEKTFATLQKLLEPKGLVATTQSPAANANALVALTSWADENKVTKISDLARLDGPLTLGGAPECAERLDCLAGYNGPTYRLGLKFTPVAYGPALVAALEANEIDVAQYGSTAPELAGGTIRILEDDKGLQSAQNVVPVLRKKVVTAKLTEALDALSAQITTKDLSAWNLATDGKAKEDPADVAQAWLEKNGLI